MTSIRRTGALAASFVACTVLVACADMAKDPNPSEGRATPQYRTGSNIPIKDNAPPMTDEERQKQQDEVRRLQNTAAGGKPKG